MYPDALAAVPPGAVLESIQRARAVAGDADDPRGQPRPAQPRRHQGRRPPGLSRLGRLDPDRALLPLAAARRPRRRSSRTPAPPSTPSQYLLGNLDRALPDRRCASSAACRRTRAAPRTRIRSTSRPARSASAPSRRCSPRWPTATRGHHFGGAGHRRPTAVRRAGRRRRARRGQRLGGGRRGRAPRPRQRHLDRRPQPPEPRPRHPRASASASSRRCFAAAGWQVLEAKYGRRLQAALRRSRAARRCASASTR